MAGLGKRLDKLEERHEASEEQPIFISGTSRRSSIGPGSPPPSDSTTCGTRARPYCSRKASTRR